MKNRARLTLSKMWVAFAPRIFLVLEIIVSLHLPYTAQPVKSGLLHGVINGFLSSALIILSCLLLISPCRADEVTVAGFAFAGDLKSAEHRFPYTFKLFKDVAAAKGNNFSYLINERIKAAKNERFDLKSAENMVNLKKSDRALLSTLVLTDEVVSSENYGSYYKTFVNLRGTALIFDYKNQIVVSSYPVSVVLFDATPEKPDHIRIAGFVADLIRREDGRGLITQYVRRMETASIPENGTKTLQIQQGAVTPEALALMPEALRSNPATVQSMLADSFGAVLSAKLGLSMLPASIGHATGGVMSMRLENGDDYKLKVGEGDYLFSLKLNKLVKLKAGENNVSTAYVYGAYMTIRFFEPTLDTTFLASDLKNGESTVIPAGQISSDDFAGYQDAIRGLFLKLADALEKPETKWVATAASAKDIVSQLEQSRKILRSCK